MSLLFRIVVYLPVLFLVAIVVVGQHHETAMETIHAAVQRTVRWVMWTVALLATMLVLSWLFIGF